MNHTSFSRKFLPFSGCGNFPYLQLILQWLRLHGFHGFLGTHQFLTSGFRNPSILERKDIRPFFSSKQVRNRGWEFITYQHFGTHQYEILMEPLCCKSLSFRNVGWPASLVCLGRWEVAWWRLCNFIVRQVKFNMFLHPNEPPQRIFIHIVR